MIGAPVNARSENALLSGWGAAGTLTVDFGEVIRCEGCFPGGTTALTVAD